MAQGGGIVKNCIHFAVLFLNNARYMLHFFARYLGSKAVKLFKIRMHGSDAVSSFKS